MKRLYSCIATILAALMLAPVFAKASEYSALLADGKEWRYTTIDHFGIQFPESLDAGLSVEGRRTLRINGTTVIDGVEYFNLYVSNIANNNTSEALAAYLREDCDTHQVWARFHEDEEGPHDAFIIQAFELALMEDEDFTEILLYDFDNLQSSFVYRFEETGATAQIRYNDVLHEANVLKAKYEAYEYAVIDGLGMINVNSDGNLRTTADLFGLCLDPFDSFSHIQYPYLYEVVDSEGKVLYSDPLWVPGCTERFNKPGTDGIADIATDIATAAAIYTPQGVLVSKTATDLHKGIYIVVRGNTPEKIYIK